MYQNLTCLLKEHSFLFLEYRGWGRIYHIIKTWSSLLLIYHIIKTLSSLLFIYHIIKIWSSYYDSGLIYFVINSKCFFLISPFNVSCGYTLEASRRGILMSTKMFFYGELTKWPHQLFGYRASLFSATAWTQMWPNRMSDIIWIQTY